MAMGGSKTRQRKKTNTKPVVKSQTREFVHRLYLYFKKENENKGPLKPLSKVSERVVDALEISRRTVSKILKEARSGRPIVTPGKTKNRQSPKTGLDSSDESAIRNIIYGFYERQEWPTGAKLLPLLKGSNLFHGGTSSLYRLLHKLHFESRKIKQRKYLMERSDIVTARCIFLRQIRRCDLKKVIFLGETCINVSDYSKMLGGKSNRLILIHAGTLNGFIPNCCHLLRSNGTGHYHKDLSADAFKNWFLILLENIPPNSLIVMDNTPHRSVVKDKAPVTGWKNKEIQDWLTKINVEWSPDMLKGELLELASIHKPQLMQYELDEIAQDMGHVVLRIPANHSEFNPIELIWTHIKEKVAVENNTFNLDDVERSTQSAVDSITSENWEKAINQTVETIELAWNKEKIVEENIEEMIIKARESLSLQSESDSDSMDSDEEELDEENVNFDWVKVN